jgi:hypothetical protein
LAGLPARDSLNFAPSPDEESEGEFILPKT